MIARSTAFKRHVFYVILGLLCLAYLLTEQFINATMTISVDEFWFAHVLQHYQHNLPYRDFAPYKTVLGYYLLLLPASLAGKDAVGSLIFIKNAIAICNTVLLFIASTWLTRFFSKRAILISLTLLLTSDLMLTYSTNIRVDLLAYWFGFFACLCLLEALSRNTVKYYMLGGLLMGIAFATSQKVIWCGFATQVALGCVCLQSTQKRALLKNIVIFDSVLGATILAYLGLWASLSSWHTVLNNVFNEAGAMYRLDWYGPTRWLFWSYTLSFNTLLFLLCPVTLLALRKITPHDTTQIHRTFAVTYALTVAICLIPYKQIFPYYMQVMIPAFLILYAAFFSWVLVTLKITTKKAFPFFVLLVFSGILSPIMLVSQKLTYLDGTYQKANLALMQHLLQDGSDYIAGMDLLYLHNQPIAGMKHLMGPAIDYLYHPTDTLKEVMLDSLDQNPNVTQDSVIRAISHSQVKYYVNNYRLRNAPPRIKAYLENQFTHLSGSIYVYGPLIPAGTHTLPIRFSGTYQIESKNPAQHGRTVQLTQGNHRFSTRTPYRLKLRVNIPQALSLDSRFQEDHWQAMAC
jgi:hypothetical protein